MGVEDSGCKIYWQEKACRKPPPAGAAGDAVEPLVRTMIVPAATLLPAVAEAELPAAEEVVTERIELPIVHVAELVEGVTLASTQVVEAPEYE